MYTKYTQETYSYRDVNSTSEVQIYKKIADFIEFRNQSLQMVMNSNQVALCVNTFDIMHQSCMFADTVYNHAICVYYCNVCTYVEKERHCTLSEYVLEWCMGKVHVLQNAGAAAALKAADELMDTADRPQNVLRIVIDNMIYPITLEVIHKVCFELMRII